MKPTILLNTGWMDLYDGPADIYGGGSWVREHGIGWEIYNFKEFDGRVYGYAQPRGDNNNIERIGAPKGEDFIEGVLAIFTATHPKYGGLYVTGWYHNAIFYRTYQDVHIHGRRADNRWVGYYVEADYKDSTLLTPDERIGFIDLPSQLPSGSGWKGRSNIFYADTGDGLRLKRKIIKRIDEYESLINEKSGVHRRMPPSPDKRKKVEKAAVDFIKLYYEEMNYNVIDVSADNRGWDLEAHKGKHILRIEVKGLSGEEIMADLTKNEYAKMMEYKETGYRLAVVTNALTNPTPFIFQYSSEQEKWIDMRIKNLFLNINESISARCTV